HPDLVDHLPTDDEDKWQGRIERIQTFIDEKHPRISRHDEGSGSEFSLLGYDSEDDEKEITGAKVKPLISFIERGPKPSTGSLDATSVQDQFADLLTETRKVLKEAQDIRKQNQLLLQMMESTPSTSKTLPTLSPVISPIRLNPFLV